MDWFCLRFVLPVPGTSSRCSWTFGDSLFDQTKPWDQKKDLC